ncbi:hypothetical protein BDW02DRAFT_566728 [Decorospora gaudefroyi]|uniref:Coenzyme Q-binding protein COQ10 START domain-containing protein n=1 Tax=Decorospora gaudefroyi TaxID=184978 RepID=A0A6A5KMP9_9PLEO|nr:hypothetical protein BDW02DRAFT_566728 [Decorospora gaudefroyi]
MAALQPTRPILQCTTRRLHPHRTTTPHRTFLPNPFEALNTATKSPPPQRLTAVRTLPYPSAPVYSIIADVPSYETFLPYCQRSHITKWSLPDKTYHRRWPSQGHLTSGFGGITESFVSSVYCIPGRYVESVGGDAQTSLKHEDIEHHLDQENEQEGEGEGEDEGGQARQGSHGLLLTHLRSKWSVEAVQNDQTQVSLAVEFAFANPVYAALSGGVAPKVAEFMIRAFEKRVREVLEREPGMLRAGLEELDGSRLRR